MAKLRKIMCSFVLVVVCVFFVACENKPPQSPYDPGKAYGVSFNTGVEGVNVETQSVGEGGKVVRPDDIFLVGYKFVGWKKGDKFWNFNTDLVFENFELVAVWEPDTENWEYTEGLTFKDIGEGYQVQSYIGESLEVKIPNLYNGENGPKKVVSVGEGAFRNSNIVSVSIPKYIEKIENEAFLSTLNLNSIVFLTETDFVIGERAFKNSAISYIVFPDCLVEVQDEAFLGSELSFVGFGSLSRLKHIGRKAFSEVRAERVIVPKGVQTIGAGAFLNNEWLEFLVLPSGVTFIGENVVSVSETFKGVFFDGLLPDFSKFDKNWKDWRILCYPYSASDIGEGGFWHYSSAGTPVFYVKIKTITFDLSVVRQALGADSARVLFRLFYLVGDGAYATDIILRELNSDRIEIEVDEYFYLSYNIEVYPNNGESTEDRDNIILETLEVDIKKDNIIIKNVDLFNKSMEI